MNRRSFLSSLVAAAPMIFVPQLIKPVWKITREKHYCWILDWGFVQDRLGGVSMEAAVRHVDAAGLTKMCDPWRQFIRLTDNEAKDWANMLRLPKDGGDFRIPPDVAKGINPPWTFPRKWKSLLDTHLRDSR